MRPDMLGEWLPLALADILSAWCGARRTETLRSWGLSAMADRQDESEMADFFDRLPDDGKERQ